MLKKKSILLLCLCSSMCMLVGCAGSRDLSEEQRDVIAEYSAGVLLQHYSGYSRKLEKQEGMAPVETEQPAAAIPEPTKQPEAPADQSAEESGTEEEEIVNEVSLDDLYQVEGMKVSYDSYVVCKSYPKKSSMFQLTAKKGKRLLIVRFQVKNATSKKLKVDLVKRKISYSLDMDGTVYDPSIAIQENGGLNFLKTNLKPGASESAILVYEIPEDAKEANSLVLTVKDKQNVSTIQVK